jgi:hypothetical protein
VGAPWIVSVGDSAISGEAGRLGRQYQPELEQGRRARIDRIQRQRDEHRRTDPGCHRSKSTEVYIGSGVNGMNLACSGARTYTQSPGSGDFKPGLDFYSDTSGRKGQALALQQFAASHDVKAVTVLIGANNSGFADIV